MQTPAGHLHASRRAPSGHLHVLRKDPLPRAPELREPGSFAIRVLVCSGLVTSVCVRASVCGFGGGAGWELVSRILVRMAREAPATQSKGHWALLMREGQRQTPPWPLEPGTGDKGRGLVSGRVWEPSSQCPGWRRSLESPEPAHEPPWTPRGLQAGAPRPSVSRAGSTVGVHDFQRRAWLRGPQERAPRQAWDLGCCPLAPSEAPMASRWDGEGTAEGQVLTAPPHLPSPTPPPCLPQAPSRST